MTAYSYNESRDFLISKALMSLEAGDTESAIGVFEDIYLRGEEMNSRLVLEYSRALIKSENYDLARKILLRHVHLFSNYRDASKATQIINSAESLLPSEDSCKKIKIALLSDSNVDYFPPILTYFLKSLKLSPHIYKSTFGNIEGEILDDSSGLYNFSPDLLLIILSGREIPVQAQVLDAKEFIRKKLNRWRNLWDIISKRSSCHIIQSNYVTNPFSPSINAGGASPDGCLTAVRRLNAALTEDLPPQVVILDLDELSAEYGRTDWWDDAYYYNAKIPFSLNAIPLVSRHITGVVRSLLGLSPKCVVLDLDNTIWGGILGEVGMNKIELGPTPIGEPFLAFQLYLKALKDTGVLLSVASKNEWELVKEVFEKNEHMVLKPEDITAWRVNWKPKPTNVWELADELNLGLDSFVFLDDNPAEREEMRGAFPEVYVPILPPDPSSYVSSLVGLRLFETTKLSKEDKRRTALYHQRTKVEEFRESVRTHEEFLAGLNMQSRVEPCQGSNLNRIHQLINKTNQFNLTTKRITLGELKEIADDPDWICRSFHLEDRFGKHGLVGVLIARIKEKKAVIDNFLMSCRVIGRTLDKAMIQVLVDEARRSGCTALQGRYIPTPKNNLVSGLYEELGFKVVGKDEEEKIFECPISGDEEKRKHFIQLIGNNMGKDHD